MIKRSISIAKLIVKRMGGRFTGGRFTAFYIDRSRIFVLEGGRNSVLTLFVDVLRPQNIVQRGLYFDSARLWSLLEVTQVRK